MLFLRLQCTFAFIYLTVYTISEAPPNTRLLTKPPHLYTCSLSHVKYKYTDRHRHEAHQQDYMHQEVLASYYRGGEIKLRCSLNKIRNIYERFSILLLHTLYIPANLINPPPNYSSTHVVPLINQIYSRINAILLKSR